MFNGASVLIFMYGRFGSSTSSLTTYPIELIMNFLLDSFVMFVMFARRGYSVNEISMVFGRSLFTLMFSISGYEDWIFSIISVLSIQKMFFVL